MCTETVQRLEKFSDPSEFERLGCDLLSRLGYRGIEPQGVGRKDGGKDALHLTEDHKTVIHFSLRQDWDKKLFEDLETTERSECKFTKFIFVSNRRIPPIRRDKFKELIRSKYGWEPVIIDQEFLRVELDSHNLDLRKKYLGISEDYTINVEKDKMIDAKKTFLEWFYFFAKKWSSYKELIKSGSIGEPEINQPNTFADQITSSFVGVQATGFKFNPEIKEKIETIIEDLHKFGFDLRTRMQLPTPTETRFFEVIEEFLRRGETITKSIEDLSEDLEKLLKVE